MLIKNNSIDLIALSSSIICAIHCATIPVVLSYSTLSSLHFLENPFIEWAFISFALVFIITSLWPSFKKVHANKKPLFYAAFGFSFIALGRLNLNEIWEICNSVFGASLVAFAHYSNYKLLSAKGNHKH